MTEEINNEETLECDTSKDVTTENETPETEEKPKKETKKKDSDKKLKSENEKLKVELEKKTSEYDELYDKYLRILAEYDNFRKRTAKEKEGLYTDAYFDAVSGMLPIIDNVERAAEYRESEKVADGIALILKSFNEMLEKMSVFAYGEVGDEFDPEYYNAVMHTEDENFSENTVCAVFQKGYRKEDKVLRYAMVNVAN